MPAQIISRLHAAQIVSRNLTASLAFLTWDICITLDQEIQYIWMTPGTLWSIKTVYLFLRYFAFFCLIAIQTVAAHFAKSIPVPLRLCRSFFLFQIISLILLTIPADMIFMMRVYALYNRQRWIVVTMAGLLCARIAASGFIIPHILPKVNFNLVCYVTLPTGINVALSLISLVPPVTTFLFILTKHLIGTREGWGTAPLMMLLTRDSSWGVIGLVGVWIVNPLIAVSIGRPLAHVGHLWFMSVVPSIGCRVILNMQRFKIPGGAESGATDEVQLTTDLFVESHEMALSSPEGGGPSRQVGTQAACDWA